MHVSRMGMMLSVISKRLCPLVGLALAFSCGKKINDPEVTPRSPVIREGVKPESFGLIVDQEVSSYKIYTAKETLYFYMPEKLTVGTANALGQKVLITYNLRQDHTFEFQCVYESQASATEIKFERCYNYSGNNYLIDLEDLSSMVVPLEKDTSIKMEIINPTNLDMEIQAIFKLDNDE